jgi:hypothetical protein
MVHFGVAVYDAGGNNSVVECDLAKVEVAGSNPVSRSTLRAVQAKVAHRSRAAAKVGGRDRAGRFGWQANFIAV